MDLVYGAAHVTLIAAARSSLGLVGINVQRVEQLVAEIPDLILVSTLPDYRHTIERSKWSHRGWCYQEGQLSKRKIVFTQNQVYYECDGMHCCESIHKPLVALHYSSKQRFRSFVRSGYFNSRRDVDPGDLSGLGSVKDYNEFMYLVEKYSSRELTFESDALNAFAGIMRTFEPSVCHFWGLPIVTDDAEDKCSLLRALFWEHTQLVEPAPRRRPEFPSWVS